MKTTIQEKRAKLKELSAKAKEMKESLLNDAKTEAQISKIEAMTINDIIVNYIYKTPKHNEFHTFKGWIKNGKVVRKGETAFLVWGRPTTIQEQENNPEAVNDNEDDFYPVSFIFSNAQVDPLKKASA